MLCPLSYEGATPNLCAVGLERTVRAGISVRGVGRARG